MTTKTFTGTVAKLNTKTGVSKKGKWTAYSAKIIRPNGEEYAEWVGFGFKRPECEEGDNVIIETEEENGFWKATSVTVTAGEQEPEEQDSGASGSTAKSGASAPRASSFSTKSKSAATEKQIHYQNSRTAAIALTDVLLKHNAVPVTATTGKAGSAKRFEEVQALVNKLTVILFHDLETFRLINDIEDVYEAPAKAETGFDGEEESDADDHA